MLSIDQDLLVSIHRPPSESARRCDKKHPLRPRAIDRQTKKLCDITLNRDTGSDHSMQFSNCDGSNSNFRRVVKRLER